MTWSFGDSFDLYTAAADATANYWDASPFSFNLNSSPARFAIGRSVQNFNGNQVFLVKASNVNDPVHHLFVAIFQTAAISGATQGNYLQLLDGATPQCTIIFRSDGAIVFTSGGPAGTVLATFPGAILASSYWYSFEFEVVIHPTAGSFAIRKNGNNANDFTASGLNTRGGTVNNYANALWIGNPNGGGVNAQYLDDFFWQSGASAGNWLGELRGIPRAPLADAQAQFSRFPNPNFFAQGNNGTGTSGYSANQMAAVQVVVPATGTLASLTIDLAVAMTGHIKMALYDSTGTAATGGAGGPGALVAQSAAITNPPVGRNVFPIVAGPTLTKGTIYWVMFWIDAAMTSLGNGGGGVGFLVSNLTVTYTGGSFPNPCPNYGQVSFWGGIGSNGMNISGYANAACVNEPQEDGLTTYVFDANAGDADFYTVSPIASLAVSTAAVITRGLVQKSDAGTRIIGMQLKSGGTTVVSPSFASITAWQWAWRVDVNDPNTGAAWTPAAINAAQFGPKVVV